MDISISHSRLVLSPSQLLVIFYLKTVASQGVDRHTKTVATAIYPLISIKDFGLARGDNFVFAEGAFESKSIITF